MNVKRLSVCLSFVGSSLLLSGILPAQAQTGNASDITGASVTSSGITSGAFAPQLDSGGGGGGGGSSSSSYTDTTFPTSAAVASVNQAAGSLSDQLTQGKLQAIATGTSIPADVQGTLENVLKQTGDVNASAQQIASALINASGGTNATLAQVLVSNLTGLTASNQVSPTKLTAAVTAYNAVIDASSNNYLTNPPQHPHFSQTEFKT